MEPCVFLGSARLRTTVQRLNLTRLYVACRASGNGRYLRRNEQRRTFGPHGDLPVPGSYKNSVLPLLFTFNSISVILFSGQCPSLARRMRFAKS